VDIISWKYGDAKLVIPPSDGIVAIFKRVTYFCGVPITCNAVSSRYFCGVIPGVRNKQVVKQDFVKGYENE